MADPNPNSGSAPTAFVVPMQDIQALAAAQYVATIALNALVQYPLSVAKIAVQLDGRPISLWGTTKSIYAAGGVLGFWCGALPGAAFVGVYMTVGTAIHDRVAPAILDRSPSRSVLETNVRVSVASAIAAAAAATVAMPFYVMRTRAIADMLRAPGTPQAYSSTIDIAWQTAQSNGIRGFFVGWAPFVGGLVIKELAYAGLYEVVERGLWPVIAWVASKLATEPSVARPPELEAMVARAKAAQDLERKRTLLTLLGTLIHYPFEVASRREAAVRADTPLDGVAHRALFAGGLSTYRMFWVNQLVGWY